MPIVSSEVWKVRDRGGNGIHPLSVFERHIDHTGELHERRYYVPRGHDTEREMLEKIPEVEAGIVSAEQAQIQIHIDIFNEVIQ